MLHRASAGMSDDQPEMGELAQEGGRCERLIKAIVIITLNVIHPATIFHGTLNQQDHIDDQAKNQHQQ